jgi:hypothetical protein
MANFEVLPLTMLVRMRSQGIAVPLAREMERLGKEFELKDDDLWSHVLDYSVMCARLVPNGKKSGIPFEMAKAIDSTDEIERKFRTYMEANPLEVDVIENAIKAFDAPHDKALAPTPPDTTDPE